MLDSNFDNLFYFLRYYLFTKNNQDILVDTCAFFKPFTAKRQQIIILNFIHPLKDANVASKL